MKFSMVIIGLMKVFYIVCMVDGVFVRNRLLKKLLFSRVMKLVSRKLVVILW